MPVDRRQTLAGLGAMGAAGALGAAPRAQSRPSEADADRALRTLLGRDPVRSIAALDTLEAYGEPSIAPGLIFLLRFSPMPRPNLVAVLRQVTGETGREDWFDWMLWQELNPQIRPTAGYRDLKKRVFLAIDENFGVFLRDEFLAPERMEIRFEEITWGGVVKDGIPSLDTPDLIEAGEAGYLRADDLVFGVSIAGDTRAYPLRIMGWHEMFNEVIGGQPVALAYCTLCGAGILFETDVPGRDAPFVFGSSGFLYRSNKLMFDRETHSLWNQFTGKPVVGPLVGSGIELRQRPVTIARWDDWRAANPRTRVLSRETGHDRNYGSGVVYRDYFASPELMFPAVVDESRQKQKDHVFGIRSFGAAKAWPLSAFEGGRVINDRVGDLAVVLVGDAAGRTVRAYDRGAVEFRQGAEPRELIGDGALWHVGEEALTGPGGRTAPRVAGHVAYWFAWDGYMGARSELWEG